MINQTVETAFRVLIYLASQDPKKLVALQDIHKAVSGSPTYLAKVTSALSRAELITSQRGANGGLKIGKSAKKITALEVIEACMGGPYLPYAPQACSGKNRWCNYHNVADKLNTMVNSALSKTYLSQMMITDTQPAAECVLHKLGGTAKK